MIVHLCQPAEVTWCDFEVAKVWLSGFRKEAEDLGFAGLCTVASTAGKVMKRQWPHKPAAPLRGRKSQNKDNWEARLGQVEEMKQKQTWRAFIYKKVLLE